MMPLALLPGVGPPEMIVIAVIGVLLFGKRLPEVGKSLGKGLAEFKKGMSGVEEEFRSIGRSASSNAPPTSTSSRSSSSYSSTVSNDLVPEPAVPKFEPPTAAPQTASVGANAENTASSNPQPFLD